MAEAKDDGSWNFPQGITQLIFMQEMSQWWGYSLAFSKSETTFVLYTLRNTHNHNSNSNDKAVCQPPTNFLPLVLL